MKKIILFLIPILILLIYSQIFGPVKDKPSINQGVYGIVRGTAYRGMPPAPHGGWSKEGPVLHNVTVQVRKYFGKDQRAGDIVATTTNERGHYEISLPEGTYFLMIVNADVKYAITTTGYQGKNFLKEEKVNLYEIINITSNTAIEKNLVVPQGWPV